VHLDVAERVGGLHRGPAPTESERRFLTCDASWAVWFQRDGQLIGAGRATRVINRRLRRALEHRQSCCAVPGCGATRGLHAHHIRHWEDGGHTEFINLSCCETTPLAAVPCVTIFAGISADVNSKAYVPQSVSQA